MKSFPNSTLCVASVDFISRFQVRANGYIGHLVHFIGTVFYFAGALPTKNLYSDLGQRVFNKLALKVVLSTYLKPIFL